MGKLDGRVAIVTGSSRGVGHFIAQELAKEGCNITVAARSEQVSDPKLPGTISSVAEELRGYGVDALPVRCDVTKDEEIEQCVAATVDHFGHVDILINNAGVLMMGPFLEMPVRRLDLIYRVNIRAPFVFTQAVLPHMIERQEGAVITISSRAADLGMSTNIPYSMSKAAIEKLMQCVADGVKDQGIRCFGLKPEGLILTPGSTYHGLPSRDTDMEEDEIIGRAAVWLIHAPEARQHSGASFLSRQVLRDHPEAR